ncbi:hypothetical protein [Kocuria rhizophila]|uniref:Hypothetical membrane protein n=1 Tax=Kocuria rhizophila (strain ATCC 9341 / DSM 348 / NBRC 103217 / DC2201) TaxID=378753 RepID=B2GG96_KOCRD|nr:hypothetical protein [Kocuria rhizophila]ASE11282.1 hypothetical protein CEP81_06225 [Kocuria rhizophila]MCC5671660.1 hypothetical protein [Kocuria rhizophila]BAG28719.1 hypothetical membrane protein [Kocuria rhizophila DC2201]VEH75986.1 Uncharacterised protein [Kocuria rhizophila]
MAETVRQIPARYGTPEHVFHPRIGSYGRRLGAALPPLLVVGLAVAMLYYRRPGAPAAAVLVLLALLGLVVSYAYLRPALAVLTASHVLVSRWVGFRAVPRERIAEVVTVEALLPPRVGGGTPRGRPQLWFVTGAGRSALALDGTVWDGKSLQEIARLSGARHLNFRRATPAEVREHRPHLVSWRVRYPRLRYAVSSLALVAAIALAVWWALASRAG